MQRHSPNVRPVSPPGAFRHSGMHTGSIFRHVRDASLGDRQWIRGSVLRAGRRFDVKVSQPENMDARLACRLNGECVDLSDAEWDSFVAAGF